LEMSVRPNITPDNIVRFHSHHPTERACITDCGRRLVPPLVGQLIRPWPATTA
jgi:hypothetical protein